MKASELIDVLRQRVQTHGDRDVVVTWEGTIHYPGPAHVYLAKSGGLFIDADDNLYKGHFAVDPDEGESA